MSLSLPANNPRPPIHFLKSAALFSDLDNKRLEEIADLFQFRAFGAGMTLFHQDMPGITLYTLAEGYVRLYSIAQSGQEYTYYIYGASDIFGELSLLDNGYHSATCVTITPVKTWLLSKENFFMILEKYPAVNRALMGEVARRVRRAAKKAEMMAFLDVQGRLVYELLNLESLGVATSKKETSIEIPLNQAELASLVGATRESVNKALAMFKSQNLIKTSGANIVIINKEGLQKMLAERRR